MLLFERNIVGTDWNLVLWFRRQRFFMRY